MIIQHRYLIIGLSFASFSTKGNAVDGIVYRAGLPININSNVRDYCVPVLKGTRAREIIMSQGAVEEQHIFLRLKTLSNTAMVMDRYVAYHQTQNLFVP